MTTSNMPTPVRHRPRIPYSVTYPSHRPCAGKPTGPTLFTSVRSYDNVATQPCQPDRALFGFSGEIQTTRGPLCQLLNMTDMRHILSLQRDHRWHLMPNSWPCILPSENYLPPPVPCSSKKPIQRRISKLWSEHMPTILRCFN